MEHNNIKYSVFSVRLSDEIQEDLNKRRKEYKSWNLLFKQLLKQGEQK